MASACVARDLAESTEIEVCIISVRQLLTRTPRAISSDACVVIRVQ